MSESDKFGTEEGDKCNRDGCEGVMVLPEVENCSCHLHPPCGACVDNVATCEECGCSIHDDKE